MKPKEVIIGLVTTIVVVGGIAILFGKALNPHNPPLTPKDTGTQSQTPSQGNAVTIHGFAFAPAALTVKKGTTVTWTNQDDAHHTITADDGSAPGGPASQLLAKGQSYSLSFNTAGTFNYHCDPHPYMKGTVVVTD